MKRLVDLPEHTQLYLSALLADVNYLKAFQVSCNSKNRQAYREACRRYENACKQEGIRPYDELVGQTQESSEEGQAGEQTEERGTGSEEASA